MENATATRVLVQGLEQVLVPVLVIDDDLAGRCLVVDLLEHAGYRVEAAVGAADARARVRGRDYGLIVADLGVDPLIGAAAVARLTRVHPDVPVLLVASFPDEAMRTRARLLGLPLLDKPFQAERLLAMVQRLIRDLTRHHDERRLAP